MIKMFSATHLLRFVLVSLFVASPVFQADSRPKPQKVADSKPTRQASRKSGKSVRVPASGESVRVVQKLERMTISPNKGYLSVVALPGAQVTLTPLSAARKGSESTQEGIPIKKQIEDEEGVLHLEVRAPSKYKVVVEHADYLPFEEIITIEPARQNAFNALAKLIPNYGSIVIIGVPPDATVLLDGKEPSKEVDPQGRITIRRVLVGEHLLKVSKGGLGEREKKLEIKPGTPEVVSADLARPTITLTVRSRPNARVLLNGMLAGIVPSGGVLTILNLDPGDYKLVVSLDGFEDWSRLLKLALGSPKSEVKAELAPITEANEVLLNAITAKVSWLPEPAPHWAFERSGVFLVKGELVALLKDPGKKDQFNLYRDFTWVLDVSFLNGKGAAWIVRARDYQNYYLFELTTSKSESGRRALNFYICRDGKLTLKDSRPVVENIELPGDSFNLVINARGTKFTCTLSSARVPASSPWPIGIFTDNTFSIGGVGFQAINGIEMVVRYFQVIPHAGAP
jgi:hypothetical protein